MKVDPRSTPAAAFTAIARPMATEYMYSGLMPSMRAAYSFVETARIALPIAVRARTA